MRTVLYSGTGKSIPKQGNWQAAFPMAFSNTFPILPLMQKLCSTFLLLIILGLGFGSLLGIAFCFSAQAGGIQTTISHAVHVQWPATTNTGYQVYSSTNLSGPWTPEGPLLEGNTNGLGAFFDTSSDRQFFRVFDTAASGITWLEGTWKGEVYQSGGGASTFVVTVWVTNLNRSFTATLTQSSSGNACAAVFALDSYNDSQARFQWVTQSGSCADGPVILTRVNATNVLYNWSSKSGPTVASSFGTLVKQ